MVRVHAQVSGVADLAGKQLGPWVRGLHLQVPGFHLGAFLGLVFHGHDGERLTIDSNFHKRSGCGVRQGCRSWAM